MTKESYLSLASLLEGNVRNPFARKKNPHGEALRSAAAMYQRREYVAAYECLKPAYEKVVADMQRILARNLEFEANKLVKEQHKPLAAAKETVQKMKVYAQQVIDQFDGLLRDLESKPLVRSYLAKSSSLNRDAPSPSLSPADGGAGVPLLGESAVAPDSGEVVSGDRRYRKVPYSPPGKGALYCVRDKARGERIIRVIAMSPDGGQVQVEVLDEGKPSKQPIQLAVDSLTRQAAKGWCSFLVPVTEKAEVSATTRRATASDAAENVTMRLDIQNFGRCCADIVRANIKFDTQLIKDVGDGPFRAGNYEQAFLTFEQCATGFTSAVATSRRAIADGRRALNSDKTKLSGKEIQERNAAFIRSEHLIHTAEREFSAILEGLRMYLRAEQDSAKAVSQ